MKQIFRMPSKGQPNVQGFDFGNHIQTVEGPSQYGIPCSWSRVGRIICPTDRDTAPLGEKFLEQEEIETLDRLINWILESDGKPTVFLPFVGEFGWRLLWHVPMVNLSTASYKVVCIKRGQEVLYPSADEFFYDWEDNIPDYLTAGTTRTKHNWDSIVSFFDAVRRFDRTRYHYMDPQLTIEDEWYAAKLPLDKLKLESRIERNIKVDVCIATRNRQVQPDKNYPHFQIIADFLTTNNLSFATLGGPPTSPSLSGQAYYSDQFSDIDAAIELLQNCKLFIGIDSGGGHLAALVGCCPMIIQQVNTRYRQFVDSMKSRTPHIISVIPFREWNNPQAIVDKIKQVLNLTEEKK